MAPIVCAIVSTTRAGSRSAASGDPENARLELGNEVRRPRSPASLARAARTGQRQQTGPPSSRATTSATPSRPTNELAGRGRLVFEIVFSGGKSLLTELEDPDRLVEVLEAMLAQVE